MFNNLSELVTTKPDGTTWRNHFNKQRWNGSVGCPNCGFSKVKVDYFSLLESACCISARLSNVFGLLECIFSLVFDSSSRQKKISSCFFENTPFSFGFSLTIRSSDKKKINSLY
jgi:hypothetical protein